MHEFNHIQILWIVPTEQATSVDAQTCWGHVRLYVRVYLHIQPAVENRRYNFNPLMERWKKNLNDSIPKVSVDKVVSTFICNNTNMQNKSAESTVIWRISVTGFLYLLLVSKYCSIFDGSHVYRWGPCLVHSYSYNPTYNSYLYVPHIIQAN